MKSRSDLTSTEIEAIINGCEVCHVAMIDPEGKPYLLPFNFGYSGGRLFIHGAQEGKKIAAWKSNPNVCVAFSNGYALRVQSEKVACSYSMKYRSVLIHGTITPIVGYDQKIEVLNFIMAKYTGKADFTYNSPAVNKVSVFEILPQKIEGKAYGY